MLFDQASTALQPPFNRLHTHSPHTPLSVGRSQPRGLGPLRLLQPHEKPTKKNPFVADTVVERAEAVVIAGR